MVGVGNREEWTMSGEMSPLRIDAPKQESRTEFAYAVAVRPYCCG